MGQHEPEELVDEVAALGNLDEDIRRHRASLRRPAGERLHGVHPAARQLDDRLEDDGDLLLFEGAGERPAKSDLVELRDAAVILGRGTVDLTVQVASSSIRSVKTGLGATVRADGGTTTLAGVVSRVGLLADDSTSNTTTYPVTVRVAAGAALIDGSSAAVSIVLKTVQNAVTVPNSALHDATVITLSNGTTKTTTVKTGAKGALVTEVTSGLKAGEIVVLADPTEELPTSSTNSNTFTPGGFGGTGGPPAGFTGGPPPGFTGGTGTVRRG